MKPIKLKDRTGPEAIIQSKICDMLRMRQWFVKETHGNMYMSGFPDVYATHKTYGRRWIEVKNQASYCFTNAQIETFPQMCANGDGVWILVAATESEYKKLFGPCNWVQYYLMLNQRSAH